MTDIVKPPAAQPIIPPSVLLYGLTGSGKTYSLTTFLEAGVDLFVLSTEANGMDSLLDSAIARKLDVNRIHYQAVLPSAPDDAIQHALAEAIHAKNFEQLANEKTGIAKDKMAHWYGLEAATRDFVDQRTGKHFGRIGDWGDNAALVIDGLSNLNKMAIQWTVGYKASMQAGDYGTAQNLEEVWLKARAENRSSYLVLLAHPERNIEQTTQRTVLMPEGIGNKSIPKIVKDFSEVVVAKRVEVGNPVSSVKYIWSTLEPGSFTKTRALPAKAELAPTFVPLVEAHKRRVAQSATSAAVGGAPA